MAGIGSTATRWENMACMIWHGTAYSNQRMPNEPVVTAQRGILSGKVGPTNPSSPTTGPLLPVSNDSLTACSPPPRVTAAVGLVLMC